MLGISHSLWPKHKGKSSWLGRGQNMAGMYSKVAAKTGAGGVQYGKQQVSPENAAQKQEGRHVAAVR